MHKKTEELNQETELRDKSPGFMYKIMRRMGSEAPAVSGRAERAVVPCNSEHCPQRETAVPFLMLDQLHAAGFSIFSPAGLVKKDSRMGWTHPHCSFGISVRSTAPHHGCPFLPCPRECMFVAYR